MHHGTNWPCVSSLFSSDLRSELPPTHKHSASGRFVPSGLVLINWIQTSPMSVHITRVTQYYIIIMVELYDPFYSLPSSTFFAFPSAKMGGVAKSEEMHNHNYVLHFN